MIVTCPECSARYRLADDAIPPGGRPMRCASCQHRWFELGPELPGEAAEPVVRDDASAAPEPAPLDDDPPAVELDDDDEIDAPRGHAVLKTLVALVLGAGFAAGAAALWVPDLPPLDLSRVPWLQDLVDPPRAPASPLALAVAATPQPVAGGRTLYALTGTLTNATATAQPVPPVEGRLLGPDGRVDYRWRIALPATVLLPGQSAGFEASALGQPGERVVVAH